VRYFIGLICLIALCATLSAANVVATASSSEPFTLRGAEVPVHGVPAWPVFADDKIIAGKAITTLKFDCGSRVDLNPGAKAHVSVDRTKLVVHVDSGDLTYKLSKGCPLLVTGVDGALIAPIVATGTAALVKGALVLGPLAAGAAAYGISQSGGSSNPPSLSPSR